MLLQYNTLPYVSQCFMWQTPLHHAFRVLSHKMGSVEVIALVMLTCICTIEDRLRDSGLRSFLKAPPTYFFFDINTWILRAQRRSTEQTVETLTTAGRALTPTPWAHESRELEYEWVESGGPAARPRR